MQKLKCPSFKISTQNLLLSVSYCLQHTMKCHIMLFRNCKLFTLSGARARFVPSYSAFQQTTSSTKNAFAGCWWCSNAEDSASQRGHLRQYCTVVSQEVHDMHTFADLHIDVVRKFTALWDVTLQYFIGLHSHRVDRWEFWHTWKSSHSRSHCHMYSSHSRFWHICVPIPMGFPRESHGNGNPMGMGIPFPCTSLLSTAHVLAVALVLWEWSADSLSTFLQLLKRFLFQQSCIDIICWH